MSARVGKGLIGVRSLRGIEWHRSQSVHIAIVVSRKEKAYTSLGTGRCSQSQAEPHCNPLVSGRASLQSTRLGVRNSVNLDGRACPSPKVNNIQ